MKKRINILLWVGFFIGTIVMLSFSQSKQNNKICSKLIINVDTETGMHFINEDDIISALRVDGLNPVGATMSEVNLEEIETTLRKIPEIKLAEVY